MSKNAKTLSQAEIDSLVQQATVKRRTRPIEKTPVSSQPVIPVAVSTTQTTKKFTEEEYNSLQTMVDNLTQRLKDIETVLGEHAHQGKSFQALLDANQHAQDTVASLTERLGKAETTLGRLETKGDTCCDISGPAERQVIGKTDKAVEHQIKEVTRCVQKTLGYNISKTFKCRSCAGIGTVAIRVKCTKCGKESWWGWWPVKDAKEPST